MARDNTTTSGLAQRFLMHLLEYILLRTVLENANTTRVGADNDVVLAATGQPNRVHAAHDCEYLFGKQRVHFACVRVVSQELEEFAACD